MGQKRCVFTVWKMRRDWDVRRKDARCPRVSEVQRFEQSTASGAVLTVLKLFFTAILVWFLASASHSLPSRLSRSNPLQALPPADLRRILGDPDGQFLLFGGSQGST